MGVIITNIRWSRKCPHCGFQVSGSAPAFQEGVTIGIPLTKCTNCGQEMMIKNHKEWIQMSSMAKIWSIINMSSASIPIAVCGLLLSILLFIPLEKSPAAVKVLILILGFLLGLFAAWFISFHSKAFLYAYAYSLYRTDTEEYRAKLGLPEPTEKMISIPLFSLSAARQKEVDEIRCREHGSCYYHPFYEY